MGFWQVIKSHPGQMGGSGKTNKKERLSFMSVEGKRISKYQKNMGITPKQMKSSGLTTDPNSFTQNK